MNHIFSERKASIYLILYSVFLLTSLPAFATNPNVKYFGYDWLDFYPTVDIMDNYRHISNIHTTNMNVVHNIENLNTDACKYRRCVLNVSAGQKTYGGKVPYGRLDICPDATNSSECNRARGAIKSSWENIWNIAKKISTTAINRPLALYFIDEPRLQDALQDFRGNYVPYQYAAYVCTLRQAFEHYNLKDIKIYTILARNSVENRSGQQGSIIHEINHQIPHTNCAGIRSMPDWIGIDDYSWKSDQNVDHSAEIHRIYSQYFSAPLSPKWVLVPPSTVTVALSPPVINDQDLKSRIQVYWDYLKRYPNDPVVAIMAFIFDKEVLHADDVSNPRYPQSRALLRFMGNTYSRVR